MMVISFYSIVRGILSAINLYRGWWIITNGFTVYMGLPHYFNNMLPKNRDTCSCFFFPVPLFSCWWLMGQGLVPMTWSIFFRYLAPMGPMPTSRRRPLFGRCTNGIFMDFLCGTSRQPTLKRLVWRCWKPKSMGSFGFVDDCNHVDDSKVQ